MRLEEKKGELPLGLQTEEERNKGLATPTDVAEAEAARTLKAHDADKCKVKIKL